MRGGLCLRGVGPAPRPNPANCHSECENQARRSQHRPTTKAKSKTRACTVQGLLCFISMSLSSRALLENPLKSMKKRPRFQGRNPTSGLWNKTDRLLPNASWILRTESVLSFKDGIRRSSGPLCNNLYDVRHIGFSSRP